MIWRSRRLRFDNEALVNFIKVLKYQHIGLLSTRDAEISADIVAPNPIVFAGTRQVGICEQRA